MRWKLAKNLIVVIVIHFPDIMPVCLTNKQTNNNRIKWGKMRPQDPVFKFIVWN